MCVHVCACVCACLCARVREREREREREIREFQGYACLVLPWFSLISTTVVWFS